MNITVTIIPHEKQRYPTVGDWQFDSGGNLNVRVSYLGDWKRELCVAIHEVVEAVLCKARGVSEEAVDNWDLKHPDAGGSFDEGKAPYRDQHYAACVHELLLAKELDVNFDKYIDQIDEMP